MKIYNFFILIFGLLFLVFNVNIEAAVKKSSQFPKEPEQSQLSAPENFPVSGGNFLPSQQNSNPDIDSGVIYSGGKTQQEDISNSEKEIVPTIKEKTNIAIRILNMSPLVIFLIFFAVVFVVLALIVFFLGIKEKNKN